MAFSSPCGRKDRDLGLRRRLFVADLISCLEMSGLLCILCALLYRLFWLLLRRAAENSVVFEFVLLGSSDVYEFVLSCMLSWAVGPNLARQPICCQLRFSFVFSFSSFTCAASEGAFSMVAALAASASMVCAKGAWDTVYHKWLCNKLAWAETP